MKLIPEILQKMEEISSKLYQWEISINVLSKLDSFPMGVSVTDEEGKFEAVNKAFCKLTGYSEQELLGQSFLMLHPEDQKEYFNDLHRKFIEEPFNLSDEYQIFDKEGKPKDVLASTGPLQIKGKKKRVTLSIEVTEQMSKKKREIEQLTTLNAFIEKINEDTRHNASKLISQETAAGIIRHDLKGYLNHVISLSKMLADHHFSKKEQLEMLQMITNSGESALQELEQTRSIELMERGKYPLNIEEFNLMELLDRVRAKLELFFKSKNLKLLVQSDNPKHFRGEDDPYQLYADKFFFEVMLTNLLQNAAEASPENETILVDISTATLLTEISIHNWGTVPEDIKRHFFEKYVTKGKEKGTGLGTYICKMIAEAHEGMINMQSEEEKGTYVVVAIPIKDYEEKAKGKAA